MNEVYIGYQPVLEAVVAKGYKTLHRDMIDMFDRQDMYTEFIDYLGMELERICRWMEEDQGLWVWETPVPTSTGINWAGHCYDGIGIAYKGDDQPHRVVARLQAIGHAVKQLP